MQSNQFLSQQTQSEIVKGTVDILGNENTKSKWVENKKSKRRWRWFGFLLLSIFSFGFFYYLLKRRSSKKIESPDLDVKQPFENLSAAKDTPIGVFSNTKSKPIQKPFQNIIKPPKMPKSLSIPKPKKVKINKPW